MLKGRVQRMAPTSSITSGMQGPASRCSGRRHGSIQHTPMSQPVMLQAPASHRSHSPPGSNKTRMRLDDVGQNPAFCVAHQLIYFVCIPQGAAPRLPTPCWVTQGFAQTGTLPFCPLACRGSSLWPTLFETFFFLLQLKKKLAAKKLK